MSFSQKVNRDIKSKSYVTAKSFKFRKLELQDLRLAARVSTLNQRALDVLAFPIEADHIAELPDKS